MDRAPTKKDGLQGERASGHCRVWSPTLEEFAVVTCGAGELAGAAARRHQGGECRRARRRLR
eukprot:9471497-Pyramimonas_sp.AAC.1